LRNVAIGMGLIIIPLLAFFLWEEAEKRERKEQPSPEVTEEPWSVVDLNGPMDDMPPLTKEPEVQRRVYPYSVVNGGVHSVEELRSAMERDPIVAEHYSNFKLERARVIEAQEDGEFHVSYRIGVEIFWTKKRLRIARGERLITDGPTFARTRCANLLSEVPRGKTSAYEPRTEVFDAPTLPPSGSIPSITPAVFGGGPFGPGGATPIPGASTLPPSGGAPFPPSIFPGGGLPPAGGTAFIPPTGPGGASPSQPILPITPIIPGGDPADPGSGGGSGGGDGSGNGGDPGTPPAPVPEPTTMILLGSSLLALWRFSKKFRK